MDDFTLAETLPDCLIAWQTRLAALMHAQNKFELRLIF